MSLYSKLDVNFDIWRSSALLLWFILLFTLRAQWNNLRLRRLPSEKNCQAPPSVPQRDPFFGLDLIYSRFTETYEKRTRNSIAKHLFATYGHTFQSKPSGVVEIVTQSPELLKAVYETQSASFGVGSKRAFGLGPLTGAGLMTTDGPAWKASRSTLIPIFAQAKEHLDLFDRHVTRLLKLIPGDNSTIDLQPLFERLSLDASSELLFGESYSTLTLDPPAEVLKFLDAYNYALRGVGPRMMLPSWDFLTRDPKFWSSCKDAQNFVDRTVDKVVNTTSVLTETQRYSLAYGLAKVTENKQEIRNQLLNLYLPTHDAISIPLTNIFFILARNSDAWAKLRQEISSVGSVQLTRNLLRSLPYLNCVISETMRLHPGISSNERIALDDTVLPSGGGPTGDAPIFVKKGSKIILWHYTMNRRKDLWGEDAEEWRPERWQNWKPDYGIYFPFGAGPRTCPASELGVVQIAWTVLRIVQKFDRIENRDPVEEYVDRWRVVTVSKNGAKVGLTC